MNRSFSDDKFTAALSVLGVLESQGRRRKSRWKAILELRDNNSDMCEVDRLFTNIGELRADAEESLRFLPCDKAFGDGPYDWT
jgi:hypothetical protein